MPKQDQPQEQPEDAQDQAQPGAHAQNESHTEVHVESHSEQHVSSGDASAAADDVADEVAQLTADLQRNQADFINFRRRAEADRAELMKLATARVVRDFLAVRDSFDAEAAHRPDKADPAWAKSIDAIRAQFDQTLAALGVTRFESAGQPFDPHRHEAVAHDGDGDTVTEQLQPGYELNGTILRPAVVKVGSKPGK